MKSALHIIRDALQDVWADLWTNLAVNLTWLLANLLIIPGPPVTLAVSYYGNQVARGETVDFTDFWRAFLQNWGTAWRWGGINFAVIAFLIADIALTGKFIQGLWQPYLQGLYLAVLVAWLSIQFFALPFLFEQETMSIRQALRNALALMSRNPGFSTAILALTAATLVLGLFAFMLSLMLGAVFAAIAGNRAVLNRLEVFRQTLSEVNSFGEKP